MSREADENSGNRFRLSLKKKCVNDQLVNSLVITHFLVLLIHPRSFIDSCPSAFLLPSIFDLTSSFVVSEQRILNQFESL